MRLLLYRRGCAQPNRNTIPGTESYPAEKGRRMSESAQALRDYDDELQGYFETATPQAPFHASPADDDDDFDGDEDEDEDDEDEDDDFDDEDDDDDEDYDDEEDEDDEEEEGE